MFFTTKQMMIDRYISGRMDVQEMRRFEEMLRVDEKLRAHYETDRAIHKALMNDKASIPANHASLETHVLSTLAAVGTGTALSPSTAGGVTAAGMSFGSVVVKTVVSIVAGLGILSGVAWYVATQRSEPVPGIVPEPRHLQTAPPTQDAPSMSQPVPALQPVPTESPKPQSTDLDPAQAPAPKRDASENDRTADEVFRRRASQLSPAGTVITPDSVQVKLKLDMNRQKKED